MKTQFTMTKISLALSTLLLTHQVIAQEQQKVEGLEVIEVTAQKRITTLQDTPIAITAFNESAIENYDISDISDVNGLAPNFKIFQPIGSPFNIGANIRGLGVAEPSLSIDPKVGIYIDGVYMARNAGAVFNIVDIERVEVLRGPQGTLWGKNTTGGALNITTKKPSGQFGIKQNLTFGDDGRFKSLTSIDTNEIGNLSARFSYLKSEYDGWATNTYAQTEYKNLGTEDTSAYRIALRYAGDKVTVDYTYDNTDAESVPMPSQISNVRSFFTDATVPTMFVPTGQLYAGNVFAQMAANEHGPERQTEFELDFHGPELVDISGHNLTFSWDVSDNHNVKYIYSSREYSSDINEGIDFDGGAYFAPALDFTTQPPSVDMTNVISNPAFHYTKNVKQEQSSHELQLTGSNQSGSINYVAGYYYFEEEGEENNPWSIGIFTGQGANLLFGDPIPFGGFYAVEAESSALYANIDAKVNDKLNIVAGLRYTKDERSLTQLAQNDAMLSNDLYSEKDWSKTVGSLLANYKLNDNVTVYGSIAQGYASGVYNAGSVDRFAWFNPANMGQANFEGSLTPADPEDTVSYELGVKSMLLDNRLMFNTAIFLNDNTNLQKTELDGSIRRSRNTGESENVGIEFDMQFAVTENLTLTASFGYQDIEYTDPEFTDNTLHNGSIAALWNIAELPIGYLDLHMDYLIVDDFQFSVSDPTLVADSYNLLNMRLSLSEIKFGESAVGKVTLWGKNVTDEDYIVHGANFNFFNAQTYGAPASYGVDVSIEF
jgi:iron complex outermembrane receptor protein